RPPPARLSGAPLGLLAQPHGIGFDIRAREGPLPLRESGGGEAQAHRVRALKRGHKERAALPEVPR
ncbi:MAG TPA: hypothetical protein VH137_08365, partial [Gemmatimonadales bacterium]|nr:hypothetical protein [Gemmatimonadales bacterium]